MSKPRVFAVQETTRWDHINQRMVPKHDLRPAEKFGELVMLLSPTAKPRDPSVIIELHRKLSDMEPQDYLLLVGNPVLIGLATAVAADVRHGRLQLLQWSRGQYMPVEVEIFPEDRP